MNITASQPTSERVQAAAPQLGTILDIGKAAEGRSDTRIGACTDASTDASTDARSGAHAGIRHPSRLAWSLPLMAHPVPAAHRIPARPKLRPRGPSLLWTAVLRRAHSLWRRRASRPGLSVVFC